MNEIQRQAYLSALGIENYMPRWLLVSAPVPSECVLPVIEIDNPEPVVFSPPADSQVPKVILNSVSTGNSQTPVTMLDGLDLKQRAPSPVNATAILQQLEAKKPSTIAPFSLSLWRPVPGFLIIDSRNTALALPTELLLKNILLTMFDSSIVNLKEEVIRWPMIENRFVSRAEVDARNELQTWLAVENELRPINRLWLMGENASKYFVAEDLSILGALWQTQSVQGLVGVNSVAALLLPALSEILQSPIDKALLWTALT